MKKALSSSLLIILLFSFVQHMQAQYITSIAGNGTPGYSGDGGLAIGATLHQPYATAVDPSGNVYIADSANNCVRMIAAGSGIISTVAGTGVAGFSADGVPASTSKLNGPVGVVLDGSGNIYISDQLNSRIRKVTRSTGIISTVAGTGTAAFSGDGGQATSANINRPYCVVFDASGNLYIADRSNDRVRKITVASGVISTIAGGTVGFGGDGGQATAANLNRPQGLAFDGSGNLYIVDNGNNRIRMINTSGIISTVLGNGSLAYTGDGTPATNTGMSDGVGIAFDAAGNYYYADMGNNCIRKVDISTGLLSTVSGIGAAGYNGDCRTPTSAVLNVPAGVTFDASGSLYIADGGNERVRKIITACSGTPAAGSATATVTTGCPYYSTLVYLSGASAGCDYSYQWASSPDGITFTNISGATNASYSPSMTNSIYFRCTITCSVSGASATSGLVYLNVNHPLVISPITGASALCPGTTTLLSDTATTGSWSASNSIVTVSSGGLVTADTTAGVDTIMYSATNACGTVTAYHVITVNAIVTPSVSISSNLGLSVCLGNSVIYTAIPTGGGTAPTYNWYVNSIFAGVGSSLTYTPSNGDTISVVMTTSEPCATSTSASSWVRMTVVSLLTPWVQVTDGLLGFTVCSGVPVTFYTNSLNGGASPSFQWAVNGAVVGAATSYTYTPSNGDQVTVKMISSFGCASPAAAFDTATITVGITETPTLTITADPGENTCVGYPVTYTATWLYGGLNPQFQWRKNGIHVGTGQTYTIVPSTGDVIECVLYVDTLTVPCRTADSVFSNVLHMVVGPYITPTATISANPGTSIFLATSDTLTATVTNGGASPTYQWYLNGHIVPGATNSVYITDTLDNMDSVYCRVHGSDVCATPVFFNSDTLGFHVTNIVGVQQTTHEGNNINLAPNPNKGIVTISGIVTEEAGDATIQVTDILGSVVYTGNVSIAKRAIKTQIALNSNLASGVYLMHVITASGHEVLRFTLSK